MKVTQSMVLVVFDQIHVGIETTALPHDLLARVRRGLEELLAGIPSPEDVRGFTPTLIMSDEARAHEAEQKLAAVQQWAADNYMAWLKDKPITAVDWDDLREALGVERLGP